LAEAFIIVPTQLDKVLHHLNMVTYFLKKCQAILPKKLFFQGNCSEAKVSKQL
jgi:hypothetical protein